MRFNIELPKDYRRVYHMPIFIEGQISERVRVGLLNLLYVYSGVAKEIAKKTENNPENYAIERVYIVGSGARENRVDSDLDLLFVTPKLEVELQRHMKGILSMVFFNDLEKRMAIDPFFVSNEAGIYAGRARVDITQQVQNLIDTFNGSLRFQ